MTRKNKLIVLGLCLLVGTAGGVTLAAFSSSTSTPSNSLSAATKFDGFLRMGNGSYIGNGTDNRTISGLTFEPDLVIVKAETNQIGVMRTSSMSGDLAKPMVGATALTANLIQSLTTDGFTLGNNNMVNASGVTYHYAAFEQRNGALKVGSYNGNGTSQSLTGPGFQPEYVAVMAATNKDAVNRFAGMTTTFDFEDDKGVAARITSLDANGFSVGNNDRVNSSGTIYHYIAINDVAGGIDQGSYTGNNTDNRSITGIGFQPGYMIIRGDDAVTNRKEMQRFATEADPNSSLFRAEAFNATSIKDLESDGFKLGTNTAVNANTITYRYLAFKNTGGGCSTPGPNSVIASEDSWVEQDHPTDNHGGDTTFNVKSRAVAKNRRGLVKFTLPTIPSDCTMTSATLHLHASAVEDARTVNVYRNSATWAQGTVTWNNQPGITGSPNSQTMPGSAGWVDWDVTADVTAMYAGSNYGWQLRDSAEEAAGDIEQAFDSTESGSDRPQLVITLG